MESQANFSRMPIERVRATSTALLILGALLIGMLVLIFALIVLVAARPRGTTADRSSSRWVFSPLAPSRCWPRCCSRVVRRVAS